MDGILTGNNTTLWLHLASWNLPDFQPSWKSKMEPSVATTETRLSWPLASQIMRIKWTSILTTKRWSATKDLTSTCLAILGVIGPPPLIPWESKTHFWVGLCELFLTQKFNTWWRKTQKTWIICNTWTLPYQWLWFVCVWLWFLWHKIQKTGFWCVFVCLFACVYLCVCACVGVSM